jgi:hypothetical protein
MPSCGAAARDAAAVLLLVRLDLILVPTLEIDAADVCAVDRCHYIRGGRANRRPRRIKKTRDVEGYECQHHQTQAPFQPVLMATHPVEHRHGLIPLQGVEASHRTPLHAGAATVFMVYLASLEGLSAPAPFQR